MASVAELLNAARTLASPSAQLDTEVLLAHVLAKPRSWLYTWPEHVVSEAAAADFNALLTRRARGEPIAYLTGKREFWSLPLQVSSATLIPRPETETLVAWALELSLPAQAAVLDLGTGSGAIALAFASERHQWQVTGVERCSQALAVACANGARNQLSRVRFIQSDWFAALPDETFDLIASNPPYIDAHDAHLQRGDVRCEPRAALVAAKHGLADIETIIASSPRHLREGAYLLLEHGCEQGERVRSLMQQAGFADIATRCDLAGLERATGGQWYVE